MPGSISTYTQIEALVVIAARAFFISGRICLEQKVAQPRRVF